MSDEGRTQVVNVRSDEYDVYIGRDSRRGDTRWGNPWSHRDIAGTRRVATRADAIECYRRELWQRIRLGVVSLEQLAELHGKRLGCHCKPEACHGDVLAAAAAWAVDELALDSHESGDWAGV